jgi:hypothetical protein
MHTYGMKAHRIIQRTATVLGYMALAAVSVFLLSVTVAAAGVMICSYKNHHPPALRDGESFVPKAFVTDSARGGVSCPCGYDVVRIAEVRPPANPAPGAEPGL